MTFQLYSQLYLLLAICQDHPTDLRVSNGSLMKHGSLGMD